MKAIILARVSTEEQEQGHSIPAQVHRFEMYGQGNCSMKILADKMKAMGLRNEKSKPLSTSMIEFILKNPFYYGIMLWKGNLYPHKYEKIVSEEQWHRAEAIREGWHKKPFAYAAKPFVFRGLVQCAECGSTLTPQCKRERNVYYNCCNKHCSQNSVYAKEKNFLEVVEKIFKKLVLPQKMIDEVVESLRSHGKSEQVFHAQAMKDLRNEYDKIEARVSKMYDDKLDGSITAEMYDKKLKEYKARQAELFQSMQDHSRADQNYHVTASLVLDLAKRAFEIFERSATAEKRALIIFVFQNMQLKDEKLVWKLKEPFNIIVKYADHPVWLPLLSLLRTDWFTAMRDLGPALDSLIRPILLTHAH